mmetsp:Transcript_89229/g.186486  ORF Transcript_89229/g.186486 Transcript_89229/m.186486 type:complete len:242 (+) Transcript_89229:304-1029(+)
MQVVDVVRLGQVVAVVDVLTTRQHHLRRRLDEVVEALFAARWEGEEPSVVARCVLRAPALSGEVVILRERPLVGTAREAEELRVAIWVRPLHHPRRDVMSAALAAIGHHLQALEVQSVNAPVETAREASHLDAGAAVLGDVDELKMAFRTASDEVVGYNDEDTADQRDEPTPHREPGRCGRLAPVSARRAADEAPHHDDEEHEEEDQSELEASSDEHPVTSTDRGGAHRRRSRMGLCLSLQ